jgi:hypothetical protein
MSTGYIWACWNIVNWAGIEKRFNSVEVSHDMKLLSSETRFRQQIVHDCFVRFHMSLILSAVIASGVLTSKLLLDLGVHSMRLRYPIAVLGSFLIFLLLVRIWIWYVCRVKNRGLSLANIDGGNIQIGWGGGSGGGNAAPFAFGGGSSGGGGASDSWGEGDVVPRAVSSSVRSGGGGSGFDIDLGDDGVILVLLAALALSIVAAGGYLIYVAPNLLPEAAWQALLASSLTKVSKRIDHQDWLASVLRATSIPFAVVLVVAGTLGWMAHRHCPTAVKLHEVLFCVAR